MTTDVSAAWERYWADPSVENRNPLVEAHIPLVKYVAGRMLPGLHSSVELQDLVSYGTFGLIDAIGRYRPDQGQFSTYAYTRIAGSITDHMRELAWEPRSVRQKSRLVERTVADLERQLGRVPTEQETATAAGISMADLRRVESDLRIARVARLDAPIGSSEESDRTSLGETLVIGESADLGPQLTEAGMLLASAMEMLPDHERILLQMLYVVESAQPDGTVRLGMTLREIAGVLEVTESWVSLLHTRAMVRLQQALTGQAA